MLCKVNRVFVLTRRDEIPVKEEETGKGLREKKLDVRQ
jgi:hypothetical protein